jgi:hypothetical protein
MGHGPALGVGDTRDDGAVRPPDLSENGDPNINRDFSRTFLRHLNSASVAAARWQRERDARDWTTARCNSFSGNQLRFQRVALMLKFPTL